MNKRVLVTGLSGFIGKNSVTPLIKSGYEIIGISHKSSYEELDPRVCWEFVDLLVPGNAKLLIEKINPTHLLHFAWYTEHQKFWASPFSTSWIRATIELLEQFHLAGGKRFVAAGSCAEYDWNYGFMSEDVTPLNPRTPFGLSKKALFEACKAFSETTGISFAWGRIFFVYGHGENRERLVSNIILNLLNNKLAETTGGSQIRDFMHASDVAEAFVQLLDCDEMQGDVNIGSGDPKRIIEIIRMIGKITKKSELLRIGYRDSNFSDPPCILADVRRLNQIVKFTPQYNLFEGISAVIEEYQLN